MRFLKWFSAIIFVVFTLTACDPTDRLVWSPDGKRCAVISSDGLRMCDASGKLSESLMDMENVEIFRWLPDSNQALIVCQEDSSSWKDVSKILTSTERAKVVSESEKFWSIRSRWPELMKKGSKNDGGGLSASFLYLKYKYGEKALTAALPVGLRQSVRQLTEPIYKLQLFSLSENKAVPGRVLLSTVHNIYDVRLAPTGKLAAVTESTDSACRLVVVSVAGGSARTVSEWSAKNPEWSRDGRTIFYVQTNKYENQASMAALVRQEIADYDEKLLVKFDPPKDLLDLPYNDSTRIRCLTSGDIIFDAQELHLPRISDKSASKNSNSQPCLFRLSRDFLSLSPLVLSGDPVGDRLNDFEVNQDGTKAVVPGGKGEVTVVDLTTGRVTAIEQKGSDLKFTPQWRSAEELCFPARNVERQSSDHNVEVILQSMSQTERRVLSRDWPANAIEFLNDSKKQTAAPRSSPKSSNHGSQHR
jgi:hypothetical protein